MPTEIIQNANLSLTFDLTTGIAVTSILDVGLGREYLSTASMLFEFAVNDGAPCASDTSLQAISWEAKSDRSGLALVANFGDTLAFELEVNLAPASKVAMLQLSAFNHSDSSIDLRVVLPKIRGLSLSTMGRR